MIASVAGLFALAFLGALIGRRFGAFGGVALASGVAGVGVWFALVAQPVIDGTARVEAFEWIPSLGVELAMRLDGLSLVFALLICFIGAMVVLYASSYLGDSPGLGRFYATLLSFMGAMLGLVLADDLLTMFVFWELTSITSFLLIGFDYERESARRCAWQALLVTGVGGLALLAGVVLLGIGAGGEQGPVYRISQIVASDVRSSALYEPAVVLVLLGCFSKSAIFPLHFWLPNAMEAPSPVSALLHSSTMVKAGIYLIARLGPGLDGTPLWDGALIVFGGVTMLFAAFMATRHVAFKKVLAYSTVSSLGALAMLLGLGAHKAAAVYLIAHAMFKACLFLVAGSVAHAAHSYDTEALGGLRARMPMTTLSAALGALSMAGMVPLIGFAGKELMLKASLEAAAWTWFVSGVVIASALLTVMAALQVGIKPFLMRGTEDVAGVDEVSWRERFGPIVLAVLGLVVGCVPAWGFEPLSRSMAEAMSGTSIDGVIKLEFWRLVWPVNAAALISVGVLVAGAACFAARNRYRSMIRIAARFDSIGPEQTWERGLKLVMALAAFSTRRLQNGSLRSYTRITLLTVVGVCTAAMARGEFSQLFEGTLGRLTPLDWMLAATIVVAAFAATQVQRRLGVIAVLGAIGFAIALFFVLHGAPDVAATQFAVETLIVIIFVLVIRHLPRLGRYTTRGSRVADVLVATMLGVVVAGYALLASLSVPASPISEYHSAESVPKGYGRNVVNVILVDFRALDTLGEIFVLVIAAVGVFTLLTIRPSRALTERA